MAALLEKALRGAGKGLAQSGLIMLKEQAAEKRARRLAEFGKQLDQKYAEPKETFGEFQQLASTPEGGSIWGQQGSSGKAANVQTFEPEGADDPNTIAARVLELAPKVANGTITPEEKKELEVLRDRGASLSREIVRMADVMARGDYTPQQKRYWENLLRFSPKERMMNTIYEDMASDMGMAGGSAAAGDGMAGGNTAAASGGKYPIGAIARKPGAPTMIMTRNGWRPAKQQNGQWVAAE